MANKTYDEYKKNPLEERKKIRKRKKAAKIRKILSVLVIISALVYYLASDISKIRKIEITTNGVISKEYIEEKIGLQTDSYYIVSLFNNTKGKLEDLPMVKSVVVKNNIFSGLSITVESSPVFAYFISEETITLVDYKGRLYKVANDQSIELGSAAELLQFESEEKIIEFAKEFILIDESVRGQISDVVYLTDDIIENQLKLYMTDNHIVLVNIKNLHVNMNVYNYTISQESMIGKCIIEFTTTAKHAYGRDC